MKIVECPRDAMQGIKDFIPTDLKAAYLNKLLQVGFDTLDFGSFVSSKVIPQMADTAAVLARLDLSTTKTKLLAIVGSTNGAIRATQHPEIQYIGFPLSVSETFQLRNTSKTIAESIDTVQEIQELCAKHNKEAIIYISMGFGNPYGDNYDGTVVEEFVHKLDNLKVKIISLSDTIGVSHPNNIIPLFEKLIPAFPHIEFGAHFHSVQPTAMRKIDAAYGAGCRRFDGAIGGFGGCPMAKDDLTGNITTETMVDFFEQKNIKTNLNLFIFGEALQESKQIFNYYF